MFSFQSSYVGTTGIIYVATYNIYIYEIANLCNTPQKKYLAYQTIIPSAKQT